MAEGDGKEPEQKMGELHVLPGGAGKIAPAGTPASVLQETQELLRQGVVVGLITISHTIDGQISIKHSQMPRELVYFLSHIAADLLKKANYGI